MTISAAPEQTAHTAPVNPLLPALELQRAAFAADPAPSAAVRKQRLKTLRQALSAYKERFVEAVSTDFSNRAATETLGAEVMVTDLGIKYLMANLATWMRTEERHIGLLFAPALGEVRYQPKGVIGVISPWNYPVQLALVPVATALAAGNRVLLKPSELTPATSALLEQMLHEAFPPDLVRVLPGGVEVGQAFSELPLDHLFYTGSTGVGRLVMKAAAANLTPVTLELGGKSPVIVHRGADLGLTVERVAWGKCLNAGQTCVAPDYVLVPRELEERFVTELLARIRSFYPTFADNPDYTAIINEHHHRRITGLVEQAKAAGARIRPASDEDLSETRKFMPTVVQGMPLDGGLMTDEIFGPVLPVVPYDDLDDAIRFVNARPRPLALYYFDRDARRIDAVLERTISGGACINEVAMHVGQDDLPFGGIGPSGLGAYHGREGFEAFSHAKAVFHQRRVRFTPLFNPPYGRAVRLFLRAVLG